MKKRNAMLTVLTGLVGLMIGATVPTKGMQAGLDITSPLPPILENQEMRIVTVTLAPGQASPPHRHNAHVFVYVLEGTIEMQIRGGPLTRLGVGETFYESPDNIHEVSRNASDTEPAKFLVHMIKTVGAPASIPVQ